MTRIRKQVIDYFYHDCTHGSTLFVLEKRWGNDGYAVFYKMLEQLGKAEGHFLDLRRTQKWEQFCANLLVDTELAYAIMCKMAEMDVIDRDLWARGIVWDQYFVEELADLYSRRRSPLPTKPPTPPPLPRETPNLVLFFLADAPKEPPGEPPKTPDPPPPDDDPPVGKDKKKKAPLPRAIFDGQKFSFIPKYLLDELKKIAPGVDIAKEIIKAEIWILDNPKKKRSQWGTFLSNWMEKAQAHYVKYGGGNGRSDPGRGNEGRAPVRTEVDREVDAIGLRRLEREKSGGGSGGVSGDDDVPDLFMPEAGSEGKS